ncbi:hypothetical protein EUTSA_v10029364mg [Eutrema salsugineum]|uniref:SWIM-type domain-containing protein n=1 Tax=Eutrema salsugineum TaxID=72664 RepID=V4N0P8_EUTSA|nr:hypothetical protein EUTSA_v10029364mg [Eutrema salsugineum]
MARDDYNLGKKTELIELTYALPVSMLQIMAPDTPPMHVTNDRQVSSLIALSRVHMVRLCVSSRVEMDTEENQEGSDEDLGEASEENSEHSTDDEADSSDVNEDGEDVDDAAYSDGEDYSVYGKVKDEDDGEDEVCIENVRNRYVNKANPGTVSALHVDSNNKFKYLFLAFGASIADFQYMRRVIVVDGCHLTGKYEVTKFRGKQLLYLVKRVAYAYNLYDYNRYMAELRQIKPDLADYLEQADVSLWSRVHFVGDRYNIKTSNVAESINVALKKARGYPISFLLDFIREKLGRWFLKRREDALSLTTHNTRGVEYLLAICGHYADAMEVDRIDTWRFYVKGGTRNCIVDLEHGMCECGVFYIEKIPCSHAIAAALAAWVSSKHLNEISNEEDFLRAVDLITLTIPWVWDQHGRVDAFFQRCLECRNPTAQYLRGVSLIFYEDSIQEGFDLIKMSSNGGCLMATYYMVMFSLIMDGSHDVFNHIRGILSAEATKMRKTMQHINRCPNTYKKPDAFHEPVFHVFAKAQSRSCACMNLPNQHWMMKASSAHMVTNSLVLASGCWNVPYSGKQFLDLQMNGRVEIS